MRMQVPMPLLNRDPPSTSVHRLSPYGFPLSVRLAPPLTRRKPERNQGRRLDRSLRPHLSPARRESPERSITSHNSGDERSVLVERGIGLAFPVRGAPLLTIGFTARRFCRVLVLGRLLFDPGKDDRKPTPAAGIALDEKMPVVQLC